MKTTDLRFKLLADVSAQTARAQAARAAEGEDRHRLHLEKRAFRHTLRHLYLAYALARGVPYARVERCAHGGIYAPQITAYLEDAGIQVADADVTAWLEARPVVGIEAAA
jgi:hypothetical protein